MSRRATPMLGRRFVRLVVVGHAPSGERGLRWRCACDCGATMVADGSSLRIGYTKSCGCLRAENSRAIGKATANKKRARKSNIPKVSNTRGAMQQNKNVRVRDAFAVVFRNPPDTTHVDRPGARVVRGGRY